MHVGYRSLTFALSLCAGHPLLAVDASLHDAKEVLNFFKLKDLIGLLTQTEQVYTREMLRCFLGYTPCSALTCMPLDSHHTSQRSHFVTGPETGQWQAHRQ